MDPTSRTSQPVLEHVHPSLLLPVLHDICDRSTPDYLDFMHNRLVPDLIERGVQVPLLAYIEGLKRRLIDGMKRWEGSLMARLESIPVLVYPEKPPEGALVLGTLLCNSLRRDNTPLELAAVYQELMQLNGWSQADLARAIKVCPAQVAKTLAISTKLCPEAQELVAAGKLPPRAAYAISRLPVQQQAELAKKAADLPMAVETVEAKVAALLGSGRKAVPKPLKFSACGVSGSVKGDPLAAFRALHGKLGEVFKQIERNPALADVLPSLLKG
jgi:ParB/RepB/Spo0J family partition protein